MVLLKLFQTTSSTSSIHGGRALQRIYDTNQRFDLGYRLLQSLIVKDIKFTNLRVLDKATTSHPERTQTRLLDDHRGVEPPDPIPNSEVKSAIADGSVGDPM